MTTSLYDIQSHADALRRELVTYTPRTLAKRLGISKRAVLKAIREKKLRAHRVNSRVFEIESPAAARWWVSLAE